jgi:hypothetical protein
MNQKIAYNIEDYNEDNAFGNRLFFWEIAYELNKNNNFKYKILLTEPWLELDFIYLPYTEKYNAKYHTNLNDYIIVTSEIIMIEGKNIDYNMDYINKPKKLLSALSFVRLKNYLVEDFIRNKTKDVVGIHIRRNTGVTFSYDDVLSLPYNIRENYIELRNKNNWMEPHFTFINDDYYFNVIDEILKINNNQKFYLSTDLPFNMISYYKDKYKTLITKEDLIKEFQFYLENSKMNTNLEKTLLNNIVDIFCLSFCKFLIKANNSTWSLFAEYYRNQPAVMVTDDIEIIKEKYSNNYFKQSGNNKLNYNAKNIF